MSIVDKCIAWNKERYPRTLDITLSLELLFEELEELETARDAVEELDACGDITFVAIGILWKLGVGEKDLNNFFYGAQLDILNQREIYHHMTYILNFVIQYEHANNFQEMALVSTTLHLVFVSVFNKLRLLGQEKNFYNIVDIICESNNTKSVSKELTDPGVKANISKGIHYVGPEDELKKLLKGSSLSC